jgi:hypothetical protein
MSKRSRLWIYRYLVARDGERCALKDETCKGELVIDEINGNPDDERPENMRLLCKSHNARVKPLQTSERETHYEQGSAEMKVNIDTEPDFRLWAIQEAGARLDFTKDEAINGGAEKFELSPTTTRKHLAKLTSPQGVLKELKFQKFGKVIRQKDVSEMKA